MMLAKRSLLPLVCSLFLGVFAIAQDTTTPLDELEQKVPELSPTELQAEAKALQAAIEAAEENEGTLADRLSEAAEAEKADVEAELATAKEATDDLVARMQLYVTELDGRDVDVTDFKVFLTKAKGEASLENLDAEVAATLIQEWAASARDAVVQRGPGWIFQAFLFLGIVFVFWLLSKAVARVVRRGMKFSKLKVSDLLADFAVNISRQATLVVGVLIGLSSLGFEIGPVLAGLGIVGFVLGFALQDTLSHFAAGLMILLYRPFDVGDWIEAAGVNGFVERMTMVSTTIKTPDNQLLIVPNGQIWGNVIKNITAMPNRRVDLIVGISYEDDIDHAERVMMEVMKNHELVLDDPEPVVHLHNMGESSLDFVVRPWCKTVDYWNVWWAMNKEIKQRFDREGISVPFPQRDLHIIPTPPQGDPTTIAPPPRQVQS